MKLTTHFCLVLWLRMVKLYLHSPTCIYGVMINESSTGPILPLTLHVLTITSHHRVEIKVYIS
jgi:hypothetical protein